MLQIYWCRGSSFNSLEYDLARLARVNVIIHVPTKLIVKCGADGHSEGVQWHWFGDGGACNTILGGRFPQRECTRVRVWVAPRSWSVRNSDRRCFCNTASRLQGRISTRLAVCVLCRRHPQLVPRCYHLHTCTRCQTPSNLSRHTRKVSKY